MQTSTKVADTSVQNIKTTDTTKTGYPIRNVEWNKDGILGYYGELLEDGRWRAFMWDKDGKSGNPKYDLDTIPDIAPTRWLCRLGPWTWDGEVTPQTMPAIMDWAQQKTGYWTFWDVEFRDELAVLFAHRLLTSQISGRGWEELHFGYLMHFGPLPLPNTKKPIRFKLPTFYEPPAHCSGDWDCVEVHPVSDDGDGMVELLCDGDPNISYWCVYLHQCSGGLECVADLATREQANSLASILMSGATCFVPAK